MGDAVGPASPGARVWDRLGYRRVVTWRRSIAVCGFALVFLSACARSGEAVPQALRDHLAQLQRGDYAAAYSRTQLADLAGSFGGGAALSKAHFEAFFRANPVRDYIVKDVTVHDLRDIASADREGVPLWETEVELRFQDGRRVTQHFSVEGKVLPTIFHDVIPLAARDAAGARAVSVDGVAVSVTPDKKTGTFNVVTLTGRHVLAAGDDRIVIDVAASKIAVVEGNARIIEDAAGRIVQIG